jgi:hypothetical protein
MNSFFRKLRWLAQPRDKQAELHQELQFHLEEEADGAHSMKLKHLLCNRFPHNHRLAIAQAQTTKQSQQTKAPTPAAHKNPHSNCRSPTRET